MDKNQAKDKSEAKAKKSLSSKQTLANLKAYGVPLKRHGYFLFLLAVLLGLIACFYLIMQAFSISRETYRQEQEIKIIQDYRLDRAKEVEDRVLQSQRAGAGPVQPNYDPNRDNPFVES